MQAAISKFSVDNNISHIFFSIGKIRFRRNSNVSIVSVPSKLINFLIPISHWLFDAFVIHGFFSSFFGIDYSKIPDKINVLAIFWGFDLYSLKGSRRNYFHRKTLSTDEGGIKYSDKFLLPKFEEFLNQRVKFVSTIVPNEFDILESQFPRGNFKFLWFSYFDLENDVLRLGDRQVNGISDNNILLGNNASPWNNHLDAVGAIKSFHFDYKKVICPLSYGGSDTYKNLVIKEFKKEIGEIFEPVTIFLDYSEYIKILSSCRYVFFNSKRQIGLGNLLFSIYIGSAVILDSSNPLYTFFLASGIQVYTIDEASLLTELPIDVESNRENLERLFGAEVVKARMCYLFKTLFS